jgi:leucine dehydrogenase
MLTIKELDIPGYEKVIEGKDPARGLHCFIAVHNSILGPALGGTRIHKYHTAEDALQDVLRLAKAMTYKSAVIQDGLGGGKSVIIADPHKDKNTELLHAFAEVLDSLKGKYIAAEDVGSNTHDMNTIRQRTPYVAATSKEQSTGDPSPYTAWGVFRGLQAVATKLWNTTSLHGRTVAIQGLGSVGGKLANILFWHGADLIISDVNEGLVHHCVHDYGARRVEPEHFFSTPCDIICPCALGGVINEKTVMQLKCKAVAGAANNQLASPVQNKQLLDRGILYAPDYIINAGGLINASAEYEPAGYNPKISREKTDRIYDHLLHIFQTAESQGATTSAVADQIAEFNLKNGVGKRIHPISFHIN